MTTKFLEDWVERMRHQKVLVEDGSHGRCFFFIGTTDCRKTDWYATNEYFTFYRIYQVDTKICNIFGSFDLSGSNKKIRISTARNSLKLYINPYSKVEVEVWYLNSPIQFDLITDHLRTLQTAEVPVLSYDASNSRIHLSSLNMKIKSAQSENSVPILKPPPNSDKNETHASLCYYFNIRTRSDAVSFLEGLKESCNPILDDSQLSNTFCNFCQTRVEFAGYFNKNKSEISCFTCGSFGEYPLCNMLSIRDFDKFEEFLLNSPILVPQFVPTWPTTDSGYTINKQAFVSLETLRNELEMIDASALDGSPDEIIVKLANETRFYFNPINSESSCIYQFILSLRKNEYGYGNQMMHGILSLCESTAVLIGSVNTGSAWHVDRASAINVGFAIQVPEFIAESPIALWIMVCPTAIERTNVILKSNQLRIRDGLKSKKLLSAAQARKLQDLVGIDNNGRSLIVIKYQYSGEKITVPCAWAHQVTNLQVSLKVAFDVIEPSKFHEYIFTLKNILTKNMFFEVNSDYSGLFCILKHIVLHS